MAYTSSIRKRPAAIRLPEELIARVDVFCARNHGLPRARAVAVLLREALDTVEAPTTATGAAGDIRPMPSPGAVTTWDGPADKPWG